MLPVRRRVLNPLNLSVGECAPTHFQSVGQQLSLAAHLNEELSASIVEKKPAAKISSGVHCKRPGPHGAGWVLSRYRVNK